MIRTTEMIHAPAHNLKDLWGTPDHIFLKLNAEFGFTLDPCCLPDTALCSKFYTPKENGLIQSWSGDSVYMNPPYSRGNIDQWVYKMSAETGAIHRVALLPVSTSADWFQLHINGKHEIRFVNKRIRFKNAPFTAPFSSMIVVFNNNPIHKTFDQ